MPFQRAAAPPKRLWPWQQISCRLFSKTRAIKSTSATLVYINKYNSASALTGTAEFLALGMAVSGNKCLKEKKGKPGQWFYPVSAGRGPVPPAPLAKYSCFPALAEALSWASGISKPCIFEIRCLQNAHYAMSTIQLPQCFVLLHWYIMIIAFLNVILISIPHIFTSSFGISH